MFIQPMSCYVVFCSCQDPFNTNWLVLIFSLFFLWVEDHAVNIMDFQYVCIVQAINACSVHLQQWLPHKI
jgi:hypothetical protein